MTLQTFRNTTDVEENSEVVEDQISSTFVFLHQLHRRTGVKLIIRFFHLVFEKKGEENKNKKI